MQRSSNVYLWVAGSAIGLGVLGDGLLRAHPFGLNLTLWTIFILTSAALLSRVHRPLPNGTYALMGCAALFCLTFVWRDSSTLKWLSGFAAFMSFALAAQWVKALRVRLAGIMTYVLALIDGFALVLRGAVVFVVRDFLPGWEQSGGKEKRRWLLGSIRGVLIAVPLVVIFGGLLISADVAYRKIISDLFNLEELVKHVATTFLCAWLAASILKGLLDGSTTETKLHDEADKAKLGAIEAGVVMTVLDLLFLSFVVVQFRYLFGGEERIREITDLTYSEYARAGFFQLCAVATLVLGVLLLGDWLLRDATPLGKRVYRVLAGLQLLMLQAMMASAFVRMWMYKEAYGLTELRLYVTAFMVWLIVVFIWFALTALLRDRREQFAFGAFVAGLAAILVLHGLNPDALIVKVNAARLDEGKSFDARYAARLSADAVPELLAVLPKLRAGDRSAIARKLQSQWLSEDAPDWRTWSWARSRAARAVRAHSTLIDSSIAAARSERGPAPTSAGSAESRAIEQRPGIDESSEWRCSWTRARNWYLPEFDDSQWRICRAPFGNEASRRHGFDYNTEWDVNTTILLRKTFWVPPEFTVAQAYVAIDNEFVLYINGREVARGHNKGFPYKWECTVPIPADVLKPNELNLVAVQCVDRGIGTGFDLKLEID